MNFTVPDLFSTRELVFSVAQRTGVCCFQPLDLTIFRQTFQSPILLSILLLQWLYAIPNFIGSKRSLRIILLL